MPDEVQPRVCGSSSMFYMNESGPTERTFVESIDTFRHKLVDILVSDNIIKTAAIAEAFRVVPREDFVPHVLEEMVYKDLAIVTKWNSRGQSTSSSSQPSIMAAMLEMMQLEVGLNVLEVGAATGYNAALLQEIVAPGGHVSSIEIQPEVAADAAYHLSRAGYGGVEVVTGDGAVGYPARAPFDRIIVTASCTSVCLAWWEQLKPSGLLVLPLVVGNFQAVLSLRRTENGFESTSIIPASFMPMQGFLADGTSRRYIGPRKDIAMASRRNSSRFNSEKLFSLLSSKPQTEFLELLSFDLALQTSERWRALASLWAFFAAQGELLFDVTTRNQIYGFTAGGMLLDSKVTSASILVVDQYVSGVTAPSKEDLGVERHSVGPLLLTFGEDTAGHDFVRTLSKYEEMKRPGLDRLQIALERSKVPKSQPRKSPWTYSFTYGPPDTGSGSGSDYSLHQ